MNKNTIITLACRASAIITAIIGFTFKVTRMPAILDAMGYTPALMTLCIRLVLMAGPILYLLFSFKKNKTTANVLGIIFMIAEFVLASRVKVTFLEQLWKRQSGLKVSFVFYIIFAVITLAGTIAAMVLRKRFSNDTVSGTSYVGGGYTNNYTNNNYAPVAPAAPVFQPAAQPAFVPAPASTPVAPAPVANVAPAPAPVAPAPQPARVHPIPTAVPQHIPEQYRKVQFVVPQTSVYTEFNQ